MVSPAVESISVVFPCYNDEFSICDLVRVAQRTAAACASCFEIVVVNDGSSDGSGRALDNLQDEVPELRVIHHSHNRGYGGALLSGFAAASKQWIFYTDGDGQYDASEMANLVAAATADIDIVQGYKVGRGDSWYRKALGRTYHHVVKRAFDLPFRDTDCDFRLMRRSTLQGLGLTRTSGVICVEMTRKFRDVGAKFVEVPVSHHFRPHGRSQFFRLPQISRAALQLGKLWYRLVLRSGKSSKLGS